MDKKTRDAIKAGATEAPLSKIIYEEKIRKQMLERAKKEFLKRRKEELYMNIKRKKKVYANEHPKFGNNKKQD